MSTELSKSYEQARLAHKPASPMEVLTELAQRATDPQVAVAVAKSMVDLQQNTERFQWEREERQAKIDFDHAHNRCQSAIGRIAPNQSRADTKSWWADYAQLDRAIRPIYTAEGFSISFSEVAPLHPGKVRIEGSLSRGGVSKSFFSEITPTTTGAKGGAMATATDADAIALTRARRYILLDIFNIAVGIDKEEKSGIPPSDVPDLLPEQMVEEYADALKHAPDMGGLKSLFAECWDKAKKANDSRAKRIFQDAYESQKRRLAGAA